MYTHIFIFILTTSYCCCFAGYELFQGFNATYVVANTTEDTLLHTSGISGTSQKVTSRDHAQEFSNTTSTTTTKPPIKCVEEEQPSNIGPYEVPTQRDLILYTKNILLDTFNTYYTDAFYLLKDIKEATKASVKLEKKCFDNKLMYKRCIKRVSTQCEQITKNLVKSLENKKQEISDLTEDRICKLADMKTDPIQVMMALAQEKVSLQFALPRFLQLLSGCSTYCPSAPNDFKIKPMRHMTDQDLVIKHFLTHKNYLELIMDSRHKTMANSN